jgi:hypothetical protein
MALYADNDKKVVAVLNKKIPLPQLLNALGHMTAGLTALSSNAEEMRFHCYRDADGGAHPAISHYPFIVLEARNSNQIRMLRKAALQEPAITLNDFAGSMLGASAEDQLRQTEQTHEADLEYFGIVLFGPSEDLNGLTKKFSLFG